MTPQQKKQLELDRDHRYAVEYPKGFRKCWPRKKARRHRAHRRKRNEMIRSADDYDTLHSDVKLVAPRGLLHKWGVVTLRVYIADRHMYRQRMWGTGTAREASRDDAD
jgi:hypothetical protein